MCGDWCRRSSGVSRSLGAIYRSARTTAPRTHRRSTGRRHADAVMHGLCVCVVLKEAPRARAQYARACEANTWALAAHRLCERSHRTGPSGQAAAAARLSSFWLLCERSHRTGPSVQAAAAARLSSFWRSAWPAAMAARPDVCNLCSACAARRSCASRSLAARVVVRSLLQCDANNQG